MAAQIGRESFLNELTRPDVISRLRVNPKSTLETAFANAHRAIESALRNYYESTGWIIMRHKDGYYLRSRGPFGPLACIHGGTTATILVLLDGRRLIVANVGDSTALICGLSPNHMRSIDTWTPLPQFVQSEVPYTPFVPPSSNVMNIPPTYDPLPTDIRNVYAEITTDHSPENLNEYFRIAQFRSHPMMPNVPELQFIYDSKSPSVDRIPIFHYSQDGTIHRTGKGEYYKNVRSEWATFVATPPHAPFQDALAFTRSLGDLHLQTYGITHVPSITWIDLTKPSDITSDARKVYKVQLPQHIQASLVSLCICNPPESKDIIHDIVHSPTCPVFFLNPIEPVASYPLAIMIGSDGIWDNWVYSEVSSFMLDPKRIKEAMQNNSISSIITAFIQNNLQRGNINFGPTADNMTAITLYLLPKLYP